MELKQSNFQQFRDAARNLLYPVIPLFVVACVWAVGRANALEAKVKRDESSYSPISVKALLQAAHQHPIVVSAVPQD